MNKNFRMLFYIVLMIHLSIILVELGYCISAKFSMKLGNLYLNRFVLENSFEMNLRTIITKQTLQGVYKMVRIVGYYFLVYLISSLDKLETSSEDSALISLNEEEEVQEANENVKNMEMAHNDDYTVDDIPENVAIHFGDQTEIIGEIKTEVSRENRNLTSRDYAVFFLNFLKTENNILLFICYVFFILAYGPSFFIVSPMPLLLIVIPYGYLKFNKMLYIKYKYAKCFFFSLYMALFLLGVGVFRESFATSTFDSGKTLPKEIYNYFVKRGYVLTVERTDSKFINVGIINVMKNVYIRIMGNFDLLSTKEQTAVLYHEIGHVENNSIVFRLLISKFTTIILMVLEFIFLKLHKNIISTKISKYGSWFLVFIILQMTFVPFITTMCNIYYQLDEYEADGVSKKNIDPKYLASALSKLIFYSKTSIDLSHVYSYFYRTHPSLINRLKNIGMF